eukprot:6194437-Pleurochrysis_carterae.AAC.2
MVSTPYLCSSDMHARRNRQIDILNEYNLLTAKPCLYLVNMSEKDFLRKKNKCARVHNACSIAHARFRAVASCGLTHQFWLRRWHSM